MPRLLLTSMCTRGTIKYLRKYTGSKICQSQVITNKSFEFSKVKYSLNSGKVIAVENYLQTLFNNANQNNTFSVEVIKDETYIESNKSIGGNIQGVHKVR